MTIAIVAYSKKGSYMQLILTPTVENTICPELVLDAIIEACALYKRKPLEVSLDRARKMARGLTNQKWTVERLMPVFRLLFNRNMDPIEIKNEIRKSVPNIDSNFDLEEIQSGGWIPLKYVSVYLMKNFNRIIKNAQESGLVDEVMEVMAQAEKHTEDIFSPPEIKYRSGLEHLTNKSSSDTLEYNSRWRKQLLSHGFCQHTVDEKLKELHLHDILNDEHGWHVFTAKGFRDYFDVHSQQLNPNDFSKILDPNQFCELVSALGYGFDLIFISCEQLEAFEQATTSSKRTEKMDLSGVIENWEALKPYREYPSSI